MTATAAVAPLTLSVVRFRVFLAVRGDQQTVDTSVFGGPRIPDDIMHD